MVYVDKKGHIHTLDVVPYELDEEGLREDIDRTVEAYTQEHGRDSVKVDSLTVENGEARLVTSYGSAEDYTNLIGPELFCGEVLAALEHGYVFDGDFVCVEDGRIVGTATKQEIYAEEKLKVVIIKANTDVQVEGDICYVSCENVRLEGANRVSIREGYELQSAAMATEEIPGVVDPDGTEEETESDTAPVEITGEIAEDSPWESDVYTFIVYR